MAGSNNSQESNNIKYLSGGVTYNISPIDDVINCDTTLGVITLYLPPIGDSYPKRYYINDFGGAASVNNIIVRGSGNNSINGQPSFIFATDFMSGEALVVNQTEWLINSDRPEQGTGTVTSVGIQSSLGQLFTASVTSPTTTPQIAFALISQSANLVYASPASGGAGNPSFRALVSADIPLIPLATGVSGILPIANGGTGQVTSNDAFNALAPSQTGQAGKYLTTDGFNTSWSVNPLGTVTSVDISGSDFVITGNPITTSGTINLVLAPVNSNVGSFGSATQVGVFTVNAKGLITAASNVTITPAASSITGGQALTKTDDTNVTLTLGGTTATALLQAVSLTLGWTGVLSGTRGGTGVNNGSNTITVSGNFATTGSFNTTLAQQFSGTITLPNATSTLATLSLAEAFINKTGYNGLVIAANTGVITSGTWNGNTIDIANGGTGQTTANAALNALLPSQTGNAGKNLQTDGTNVSWVADAGGTVTSVSATGSQGITFNVATPTTTPSITMSIGALIGVTSFNGLVIAQNTGIVTSGTWNAATIGTSYGGTGLSSLGTPLQQLRVNISGTALEYFTDVTSSAYINGGNSFGGNSTIGLNDAFSLSIKTDNISRLTIGSSGNIDVIGGDVTISAGAPLIKLIEGVNNFEGYISLLSDDADMVFSTDNVIRATITHSGNIGIGVSTPTSRLQLPSGQAGTGLSALKFTSGVVLTTPESGAIEWDGTNLFYTTSTPTRLTVANTSSSQTFSNKTIGNTNTVTLKDTLFTLQDDGDTTKQMVFQLSGITTATTRTLTVPNASGTIALTSDLGSYVKRDGTTPLTANWDAGAFGITANNVIVGSNPSEISGSSTASGVLNLSSTTNATKGQIRFGTASAYSELNNRLGINNLSPSYEIDVVGDINITNTNFYRIGANAIAGIQGGVLYFGDISALDQTVVIQGWSGNSYILFNDGEIDYYLASSSGVHAFQNQVSIAATGSVLGTLSGNSITVDNTNTSGSTVSIGQSISSTNSGTGSGGTTQLFGQKITATISGSRTYSTNNFAGLRVAIQSQLTSTPTFTDAIGIDISAPFFAGTKPTTNYGQRIRNQGASGVTTSYALNIDAQSGSTNNYAIVSASGNKHGFGTLTPTEVVEVTGNLKLSTAGNRFYLKSGTNSSIGTSTMVAGTVTVSNTSITANSIIQLTPVGTGVAQANAGSLSYSIVAGVSFTIYSTNVLDTRTVSWTIVESF